MFLPIFSMAIGLFFTVFGVRIFFFKHYRLISDYTSAKGERYGRTVGLIQMLFGIAFVASGGLGIYLLIDTYSYISLFALFGGYILAMNLASRQK